MLGVFRVENNKVPFYISNSGLDALSSIKSVTDKLNWSSMYIQNFSFPIVNYHNTIKETLAPFYEATNFSAYQNIVSILDQQTARINHIYSQAINLYQRPYIAMNSALEHLNSLKIVWPNLYKFNFENLAKFDFRIGVVSQELEQTVENGHEEVAEKLLFKDTSKPSNDLESQLFDILNEQRKIINDSFDILNKINDSQSKDITDNELTERHNSPAFYEDKMWYLEQIGSNLIGLFVSAIVAATIGVDPENTIVLALLLGCLVKFLK